ncbi:MAG: hypothetical protein AAF357_05020, partial [Verrucomicrobiota bacterium]
HDSTKRSQLILGVHRLGGITEPLQVIVNGTTVNIDLGDADEFAEFFAPLDADLPMALLEAENEVRIQSQEGTTITSVQIVTLGMSK